MKKINAAGLAGGIWAFGAGAVLSTCVTTKDITYFRPLTPEIDKAATVIQQAYVPRIVPGDILQIDVSSINPEASSMFNPTSALQTTGYQSNSAVVMPPPIVGFQVAYDGAISLPLVGRVEVQGKTSQEVAVLLTTELGKYLTAPTVLVRIASYKVSVLGEVARPAVYTIPNERVTLPEALAMAGDITAFGKKKSVMVIREVDGVRQFVTIDMTSRAVFDSPYYYLRSGDVVYVGPLSGRATASDRSVQTLPLVLSSLTFIMMIVTAFIK